MFAEDTSAADLCFGSQPEAWERDSFSLWSVWASAVLGAVRLWGMSW